jgi:hypothetical protein
MRRRDRGNGLKLKVNKKKEIRGQEKLRKDILWISLCVGKQV